MPEAQPTHPARLRKYIDAKSISSFIGIYDIFSARIAARHFDGLFLSGFGFSASFYGLPDYGFVTWTDLVNMVERLRAVLPAPHLIVDAEDGFSDPDVAGHVARRLEAVGASGVVIEDQARPRRCGHFEGKRLLEPEVYIEKLRKVIANRTDLFVIARTDATDREDILNRALAYCQAGADAVLADGLTDMSVIAELSKKIPCRLMFNQLEGGKSPPVTLSALADAGISLVNYSTPCLFAVQDAMEKTMTALKNSDGCLSTLPVPSVDLRQCRELLEERN